MGSMSAESELMADIRSAPCEDFRQSARDMRATAAHLIAEGWTKPREVRTAAELDALRVGSVVRSSAGTIACKCEATRGVVFGDDRTFPWLKLAAPATVLHEPGEGQ